MRLYSQKAKLHSKFHNSSYFCPKLSFLDICLTKCPTPRCHRRPNSGCLFSQHFFVVKTKRGEIDYFPAVSCNARVRLFCRGCFRVTFGSLGLFPGWGNQHVCFAKNSKFYAFKLNFLLWKL